MIDYVAIYLNIVIRYYASDMKLFIDSDAAYLVLPNAKSRIARYYYLSSTLPLNNKLTLNMLILVICKMLCYILSSAAEAETTSVFINT